jgi:hypothetical protein
MAVPEDGELFIIFELRPPSARCGVLYIDLAFATKNLHFRLTTSVISSGLSLIQFAELFFAEKRSAILRVSTAKHNLSVPPTVWKFVNTDTLREAHFHPTLL